MTGALRSLMRRHGTSVYRYCREALRDTVLAEDVQQQVFIAAFRDLPRFNGRSTVRTWLFAIARHRVLDAAKSRRRARSHVEGDDAAQVPDPRPSPGERMDDARLHEALFDCMQKLAPHVLTALLLRFQQGFTFEEMAVVCHEKPGTLQAQVRRAMPALRTCIETHTGGTR
jgi:RNA polymerase sigma-70 factor (ECF subfamily)